MEKVTNFANSVTNFVEKITSFFTGILDWIFGLRTFYKIIIILCILFLFFVSLQFRIYFQQQKEQVLREMKYRGIKVKPVLTESQQAVKDNKQLYNA